jgi:alkanesulfonate monooxygenase
MRLGAFLGGGATTGAHAASWRHPDARADAGINFPHFVEISRTAERGKFDFVFIADNLAVREAKPEVLSRSAQYIANFEPLTLVAALSAVTERIGFVATASTSYSEPHNLAGEFASIDNIGAGRVGWNIVTSSVNAAALNFGLSQVREHAERYRRAREFTRTVGALWDEWAGTGARGHPVLVQAGASDDGRDFAAEFAEAVFTNHPTLEAAQEYYADVKARALRFGRSPESILIMPGISPSVGRTEAEADEQYEVLQSLVDPIVGLEMLTMLLGTDLSPYSLDGPLPELVRPRSGSFSTFENWTSLARREHLTIRQLIARTIGARGKSVVVGSAAQVADHMQHWFENGAADGFNIMPPHLPGSLNDFVELVIPELQERGLFRREYTGTTLRDHLGLARPERTPDHGAVRV